MAVSVAGADRAAKTDALAGLDARHVAYVMSALACEQRIEIVRILAIEELDVGRIAERLGESMANTSQHLMRLREAGIVVSRRDGSHVLNRLGSECMADLLLVAAKVVSTTPDGRRSPTKVQTPAKGKSTRRNAGPA